MQRYFISNESIEASSITITGSDFHHLANVLRAKPGEKILCVAEQEKTALVEITEITNEAVHGNVIEWIDESKEMPIKITIASGLPKGDKLDYIIQKGTELGAAEFIPFIAARSIVKWDEKKAAKKIERLQKIAKEAAEQSHRGLIPSVATPVRIHELIKLSDRFNYKLIAYEEDAKTGESSLLASVLKELKYGESVLFVFGPEGGLSSDEIVKLKENGFASCGLGPRILRTETAPLYALSAISYHTELLR
ncbi:16S rRNA (uracil1498-N3)-methyltransferase [Peribacillus deserti]|uniref:Ribosomal RNA small subunit methyltransferase E n=1 Tax=Peribacillus deserti TaxID=673318 RepID=A0ABS2QF85_9BACI|nr:16S rRNA (uracil(1498)-N(3))-methyltransferase [Peribacillus deserti]MBM7691816.1 16S rRNA (uracil1498-N3)-methyltransferase [Peribacillus deserti]